MLIQEVIELLKKCNQEEDFSLFVENDELTTKYYLNNKVFIPCKECCGTGKKIYESTGGLGYCSNGDYRDPTYTEYEADCNVCDGEAKVEMNDWDFASTCLLTEVYN